MEDAITHTHVQLLWTMKIIKLKLKLSVVRGKMHFCALGHKKQAYIDIKNMYLCDVWGLLMLLMLFLYAVGDVIAFW